MTRKHTSWTWWQHIFQEKSLGLTSECHRTLKWTKVDKILELNFAPWLPSHSETGKNWLLAANPNYLSEPSHIIHAGASLYWVSMPLFQRHVGLCTEYRRRTTVCFQEIRIWFCDYTRFRSSLSHGDPIGDNALLGRKQSTDMYISFTAFTPFSWFTLLFC